MIRDVVSVHSDATIKEVMQTFVEKKVGGVPIVDTQGKLVGIITDGDILRAIKPVDRRIQDYFSYVIYLEQQNLESRIHDIADQEVIRFAKTRGIVTVFPDDDMREVVLLLAKHHFKKLPVINQERRVVGVVSRGDAIRNIQQTMISGIS